MADTSKEAVERLAQMAADLSTLMSAAVATATYPDDAERRDKLLRSTGYHRDVAAVLRALLAERDAARADAARLRAAVTLGADALDALLDGGAILSGESARITQDFVRRMRAALNPSTGDDA